jgi:hypothetical protein
MIIAKETVLVVSKFTLSLFILLSSFLSEASDVVSGDDRIYVKIKIQDELKTITSDIQKSVLSLLLFKKKLRTVLLANGEDIKVDASDKAQFYLLKVNIFENSEGISFKVSLFNESKSRLINSVKKNKVEKGRLIHFLSKALRLVLYK